MICPKCNLTADDDARFCEHCGSPLAYASEENEQISAVTDDIEKTMVIPVIKTETTASVNSTISEGKKQSPRSTDNTLKSGIITALVSFFIALTVGLGVWALVTFTGTGADKKSDSSSANEPKTQQMKNDKKEENEEPVEITEGTSEGKEEKAGISVDTDFDFALGRTLASTELSYKTLKSTEFAYECDIPSGFKFVSDADGEIRYRADDSTAYIDIGAFANEDNLTINEIKAMVKEELGGTLEHEDSGDGWFTMTARTEKAVYYFKCYADEYIRYIEFAYPAEYRDVYDVYVSDIEPTFKRLQ